MSDPFGAGYPTDPGLNYYVIYDLRFPGQYEDIVTARRYNYFRDYDPHTGRYLQSDPIGLQGGQLSTYSYVNGNPVDTVDQYGLLFDSELAALLARQAAASPFPWVKVGLYSGAAGAATYQACFGGKNGSKDDECKEKLAKIWQYMNEIEARLTALHIDKLDLFTLAYSTPSPSLPKGSGSWLGHIHQVTGLQNGLRNLIKEAIAAGCYVPKYAWQLAYAPIPTRPLSR